MPHLFIVQMINKQIILIAGVLFFAACNNSNKEKENGLLPANYVDNPRSATGNADLSKLGTLTFKDSIHSFGNLKEGEVVEYAFEYQNVGKKEVIITDASSTCGCTVPDYKREPIAIGEKGEIKVKFNSEGKSGYVEKPVTLRCTGNPGEIVITISATVEKK